MNRRGADFGVHCVSLASRRHGRGQSMTEMIIVSLFFLVPLFLFMSMIVKYLDMRSSTLQASRYVAFERTVYSATGSERKASMAKLSDADLAHGVRTRFFSDGADAITQGQNSATASFSEMDLWTDPAGTHLVHKQDVKGDGAGLGDPIASAADEPGGLGFAADSVLKVTLGTLNQLPSALDNISGFQLSYKKYYTAHVSVSPAKPNGSTFSDLQDKMKFHDHDTLLADGWSASDIKYEHDQAARMVPTGVLSFLSIPVINDIGKVALPDLFGGLGVNGNLAGDSLGYVVVNTAKSVPADRLKGYKPTTNPGGDDCSGLDAQVQETIDQYKKQGFTFKKKDTSPDGKSVTLTFEKQGAQVTQTVSCGGSTGGSDNTTTEDGTVYQVTGKKINYLYSGGYRVTSGPVYTCGGGTCPTDKDGNYENYKADHSKTILKRTLTTTLKNGKKISVTSIITLTIDKAGKNTVTVHQVSTSA